MQAQPRLDSIIFEVRYAYGHLYYDKCGQILNDVERNCEGWIARSADINTGLLECPKREFRVGFNNIKFDFTSERADKQELEKIAKEASSIWKIIRANLGLNEFFRIGCRVFHILPTVSIEDADKLLCKKDMSTKIESDFIDSGYKIKTREITTVLTQENTEYRVKLGSITRAQSIDPSILLKGDPRAMSKHQRETRMEALKRLREYTSDPMYAILLDVDCVRFEIDVLNVEDYIVEQTQKVIKDFYPILTKLCQ